MLQLSGSLNNALFLKKVCGAVCSLSETSSPSDEIIEKSTTAAAPLSLTLTNWYLTTLILSLSVQPKETSVYISSGAHLSSGFGFFT